MNIQGVVRSGGSKAWPGPLGPAQPPKPLSVLGTKLRLAVSHAQLFHFSVTAITVPSTFLLNAHLSLLG